MATNRPGAKNEGAGEHAVDAAFAEVMAAEQAAEAAVAACREQAERRLAEARAEVGALAERSVQRYREWCARQAAGQARALAALAAETRAAAQPVALDDEARQRLEQAVERLADELCGRAGEPG
ncbi:MAG: hypothetical protein HYU78_01010 [Rhodocyclales bacterium]|nr:hypothetical protein [Rhodocyclales bacterium]